MAESISPQFQQVTLWEISQGSNTIKLTSDLPTNLVPISYPTTAVWIGNEGWFYTPIRLNGYERALGPVPGITASIDITDYIKEQQQTKAIFRPGTTIIRYQTDTRAVDTVNWPNNINPFTTTVKRVNHKTDRWTVSRLRQQNNNVLTVELQNETAFWSETVRPNIQGRCYHTYRDFLCGYQGNKYWDVNDKPVSAAADDVCGLTIKSCSLRFPTGNMRYGGNPENEISAEEE